MSTLPDDHWEQLIKALQLELTSEREQLAAERERADHNVDIADSIGRASRQVEQQLRDQLAARQRDITECITTLAAERERADKAAARAELARMQLVAEREKHHV